MNFFSFLNFNSSPFQNVLKPVFNFKTFQLSNIITYMKDLTKTISILLFWAKTRTSYSLNS